MNRELLHSMNVTPFIDIMLVLLAVLMISYSATVADLQVNLPQSSAAQERTAIQNPDDVLSIDVLKSGVIMVKSEEIAGGDLSKLIAKLRINNENLAAIINADKDVVYGKVTEVIDALKKNGINKVSLTSRLVERSPS